MVGSRATFGPAAAETAPPVFTLGRIRGRSRGRSKTRRVGVEQIALFCSHFAITGWPGQNETDWEFRNDVRIDRLGYNRKPVILLGASPPRGALPSSKN